MWFSYTTLGHESAEFISWGVVGLAGGIAEALDPYEKQGRIIKPPTYHLVTTWDV